MQKLISRTGWILMALLAVFLFALTTIYFSFEPDVNFLLTKPDSLVEHVPWRLAFYVHITSAMVILVLGPLQFLPKFRAKYLKLHRWTGRVYVFGILAFAAPSGMYMAFFANGGVPAEIGFALMSSAWFTVTLQAYRTIRKGEIEHHRKWMVRSYALTFAAVTLRIWVPLLSFATELDHVLIEQMSAWISWIPNLLVAEAGLRLSGRER